MRPAFFSLVALGALLTFSPAPPPNPPVLPGRRIDSSLDVPPPVQTILRKACNDCHSNATRWPWYSGLPLVSGMIRRDVAQARSAVNFSEWSLHAGRTPGLAIGLLMAACEDVKSGRMPPRPYRIFHSAAALTGDETASLCDWSTAQIRRLRPVPVAGSARGGRGREAASSN